jgi:hypothetical protein
VNAAFAEAVQGIRAERQSPQDIATPHTAEDDSGDGPDRLTGIMTT